jgi:signal transduction histidine kinase
LKSLVVWLLLSGLSLAFSLPSEGNTDPSWAQVYKQRQGVIKAIWFESRPFIYRDTDGKMKGIEYELVEGFAAFIRQEYNVNLKIEWIEGRSFSDTYAAISNKNPSATFGLSAFSITTKRDETVDFSPPYMSDISVLITSDNIPILSNVDALHEILPRLQAVTIRETTYEQELKRLRDDGRLGFTIDYIPSSENIMETIAARDSAFGFIDLPVYMMLFHEDPSIKVKRQNLLPLKREGYAIIYRENGDWRMPLEEYFQQPQFKGELEKIAARYIDLGLYHFVEQLAEQSRDETIMLLTKEKEIQYRDLLGKADIIVKETRMRKFLFSLTVFTLISLVVILTLYRKRNEQKEKIEAQGKVLAMKGNELEQQNQHLRALDEEKNNLIRILAHDLRMPINHIQGMAQIMLLEKSHLTAEQLVFVEKIVDSAVRVNKMISHLLDIDALENERIKVFLDDVELNGLLQKVVNSFEKQAQQKEIELSFDSAVQKCLIKGEALYLFEIFENLISNAIKFSFPGNPVAITISEESGFATVAVKDHGPGLTADDLQNLFKKYQRLSAKPTSGEPSVGLGLSIVKKYVELMSGTVWCESEPGQGATFIVKFPLITQATP